MTAQIIRTLIKPGSKPVEISSIQEYCVAKGIEDQWRTILTLLAQRDGSVELMKYSNDPDTLSVTYRTRLFDVRSDGSIIVERPGQAVIDKAFANGNEIELMLMHNHERLIATCRILETSVRDINSTTRVVCYRLSPGRRPHQEQRRSFFRVGVAATELEPVRLLKIEETEDGSAHKVVLDVQSKLVNLSAGGLGVTVRGNPGLLAQIKRSRDLFCHTIIDNTPINAPARIAHAASRGEGLLYLGLQFAFEDEAQALAMQNQMQQLCTQFQRQQLQRRRA